MSSHEYYMASALRLAEHGLFTTDPNPRVGCVLVKDGEVVGQGWHQRAGEGHAEVNAIHQAGTKAQGADCYVTLEPCSHFGRTPPCVDSLLKAGVRRVFVAMSDPNPIVAGIGIQKLQQAGIDVSVGLLANKAEEVNPGFCKRMRNGMPYVRTKLAMSLDGRTAMSSGESQWITGPSARLDVHKLRARSSAIVTGIGTILKDDPSLTVRPEDHSDTEWYHKEQEVRQPLRVVVDSQLRTPETAQLFKTEGKILLATASQNKNHVAEHMVIPNESNLVDLQALMKGLAKRQINEVMVEAGAVLNGALLAEKLIDEIIIYLAPKLMGDQAKGLFHLPAIKTMAQNIQLEISDIRAVGRDWRVTAKTVY